MQDRVAEVLAQRTALGNGTVAGVLLSLLLHGGLTAAAVYAALHHTPTKTASVLAIRFAPAAQSPAANRIPPAQPAAPKRVEPRIESPRPEPVKPVTGTQAPEKNTVPLSPFGRSTKKGSETPEPPKPVPAAATPGLAGPTVSVSDVPVGGTGITGLEGGDFPYTVYIDRMLNLIGQRWVRPQVAAGVTTTVYFVIERDGTLRDIRNETPSGNSAFDRAALRALLESSPLPTLPFNYNGTYLGVHLTFR